MVARLQGMPEWDALWRAMDEVEDRHWTRLAREFATKDNRPDYATLQWQRGFFAFSRVMRRNPVEAIQQLERLLAEQREDA